MNRAKPDLARFMTSVMMGLIVATALFVLANVIHTPLTPESVRFAIQDEAQRVSNELFPPSNTPKYRIRLVSIPPVIGGGMGRVSRIDIARVVKRLDEAKAGVIILETDLTGASPGDPALSASLSELRHATAIVTLQLSPRPSGACDDRTALVSGSPASANEVIWPAAYDPVRWKSVHFASAEFEEDFDRGTRSMCPFTTAWWTPSPATAPSKLIIPSLPVLAAFLSNASTLPSRWSAALGSTGQLHGLPDPRHSGLQAADFQPQGLHFVATEKSRHGAGDSPIIAPGMLRFPYDVFESQEADLSDLKDAIVIVGSTDRATGDRKMTPLGSMSGQLLVANAVAAVGTNDYLASKNPLGFAEYWMELLLVLAGCTLFFLINDAVPMWIAVHVHLDSLPGRRPLMVMVGVAWFLFASIVVGSVLLFCTIIVAAFGVTRGIAPDPAATMLSITADRLIHAGGALEMHLHHLVTTTLDRWGKRRSPSATVRPGEQPFEIREEERL